jgi:hypothetical protein
MPRLAPRSRSPIATNAHHRSGPTVRITPANCSSRRNPARSDDKRNNVTINENGGIFNAAVRPTANWNSTAASRCSTTTTPLPRWSAANQALPSAYDVQAKPWATLSGAYNDLERHNNTNNNQSSRGNAADVPTGPLDHVDHSRVASLGAVLFAERALRDRFQLRL